MKTWEKVCFSRLSQQQLAEAHRCSTRTIREWQQWGMPRNEDGTYNLPETYAWRHENANSRGLVCNPFIQWEFPARD
jgi:hypothetical protein